MYSWRFVDLMWGEENEICFNNTTSLIRIYKKSIRNKLTIYQSNKVRHVMDFSIEQMLVLYHHPMMPICV